MSAHEHCDQRNTADNVSFAMTILLFGLFGWRAGLIVLAAISIALISGGIYQHLGRANIVLWWILIGILVAAALGAYVPQHIFMDYLGPNFRGMSTTLLFATVIEVCSDLASGHHHPANTAGRILLQSSLTT